MIIKEKPNELLIREIRRTLAEGKQVELKAKGNSMLPFIRDGRDSVILERPTKIRVGDILLGEYAPDSFVLHRLIRKENGRLVLMGDGNPCGVERCLPENVVARVVRIIRPDGGIIDCDTWEFRFRSGCWRMLLPVRRYLLAIIRRIR